MASRANEFEDGALRTVKGGRPDYDALFREVYPPLFRYLRGLSGDPDEAEEIAQEAFARLLRQTQDIRDERVWLFAVATNLFRDQAKTRKRRGHLLLAADWQPAPVPTPDRELERKHTVQQVRRALQQLSERDRQLLMMRHEGFRYDEIAEVVGVARTSVGALIARAIKRFLSVYDSGEDG